MDTWKDFVLRSPLHNQISRDFHIQMLSSWSRKVSIWDCNSVSHCMVPSKKGCRCISFSSNSNWFSRVWQWPKQTRFQRKWAGCVLQSFIASLKLSMPSTFLHHIFFTVSEHPGSNVQASRKWNENCNWSISITVSKRMSAWSKEIRCKLDHTPALWKLTH